MYQLTLMLCWLTVTVLASTAAPAQARGLLLTGQVKASDNQTFYSPKTDNWRVQLQWLLPEGEIAEKGDLVVVFDSGNIQSQIEQEQVSLISAEEELKRLRNKGEQKILEAGYGLKKEKLLLEKARLDAGIPRAHLSSYDYEKNQLALEKSLVASAKAEEELAQAKVAHEVAIAKQTLKITRHKDTLAYRQGKLEKMSLYAERTGPVLYGYHPWNGEKIFVGMTAQPSWAIAEIPSLTGLYVESWVHEVDYNRLKLGQKLQLVFDAFPQKPRVATLTELSTQPEERKEWGNDVYFRAVFSFPADEQLKLLPGMSAQLELVSSQIKGSEGERSE
ncbi:HlyD family secretion protein [Thalassomonas actiniarum]|uniref:HlyD family efflux transporter periplasmic adaptor subunit n=1 Tax=Thalassomonas actiniarum TaxID=485447 RepID=A0AAF0C1P4_9GAMM|nr:HlyD family efflux transporter periplasmic adaptor subunit [Thalassomonas actiniarum]WDD97657.1 HlyD family efflux transporter periplasmic adaptor subunit [Thalassomonas actiniarum]